MKTVKSIGKKAEGNSTKLRKKIHSLPMWRKQQSEKTSLKIRNINAKERNTKLETS